MLVECEDYKPLQLPESRFTKYRVSGDSDEIAEVGETLVYYIETKDELMFSCFKQLTYLVLVENDLIEKKHLIFGFQFYKTI